MKNGLNVKEKKALIKRGQAGKYCLSPFDAEISGLHFEELLVRLTRLGKYLASQAYLGGGNPFI